MIETLMFNKPSRIGSKIAALAAACRDCPWKVRNELQRLLLLPAARLHFRMHAVRWNTGWKIYGLPIIQRDRKSVV